MSIDLISAEADAARNSSDEKMKASFLMTIS